MKIKMKNLLVILLILLISGCAIGIISNPMIGDRFDSDLWADKVNPRYPRSKIDNDNFYIYMGQFEGKELYKRNPHWIERDEKFKGAIFVSNYQVVGVLSEDQMIPILKKLELEKQRELKEKTSMERTREKEKTDVEEREKAIEAQKYENCLNESDIGVCNINYFSNQSNDPGMNLLLTLGALQANDQASLMGESLIKLYVRNNKLTDVKDITFTCDSYAASGTVIYSENFTIFNVFPSKNVLQVTSKIRKVEQTASIKCRAKNYKRI